MSVNGMVSDTFSNGEDSVFGDGADDYGQATGPETLPQNETFGVAFTFESTDKTDLSTWFGFGLGPSTQFTVEDNDGFTGANGLIAFRLEDDNGNDLTVQTDSDYVDGNPHLVVINKGGNAGSNVDIYVDDMTTPTSSTVQEDDGFDHTSFTQTNDMMFYAVNDAGSPTNHKEMDAGIFEFNTEQYTESERTDLKNRRPEV
jgi:hypothetical protein